MDVNNVSPDGSRVEWLIETHAHLHASVDPFDFLTSTRNNFLTVAGKLKLSPPLSAIICLADFPAAQGFKRLCELPSAGINDAWIISQSAHPFVLDCFHSTGDLLYIVAGRQMSTNEGLEVLAVGLECADMDRMPLREMVVAIHAVGAIPFLPWGAGKWLGFRGRVLKKYLQDMPEALVVGDNAGRPWIWPSSHLRLARELGIPVLPGTDPLNLRSGKCSAGSSGVVVRGVCEPNGLLSFLKKQFLGSADNYIEFGSSSGVFRFVRDQIALRNGS